MLYVVNNVCALKSNLYEILSQLHNKVLSINVTTLFSLYGLSYIMRASLAEYEYQSTTLVTKQCW